MAFLIKNDGAKQNVTPEEGRKFSLNELQGFVGGYIEVLYLSKDMAMVVDEEGKLKGKTINNYATRLFRQLTLVDDFIVGDVLVTEVKFLD